MLQKVHSYLREKGGESMEAARLAGTLRERHARTSSLLLHSGCFSSLALSSLPLFQCFPSSFFFLSSAFLPFVRPARLRSAVVPSLTRALAAPVNVRTPVHSRAGILSTASSRVWVARKKTKTIENRRGVINWPEVNTKRYLD